MNHVQPAHGVGGIYESQAPPLMAPSEDPLDDGLQMRGFASGEDPFGEEASSDEPAPVRFYRAPASEDPIEAEDGGEARLIVWAKIFVKKGTITAFRCETSHGKPRIEAMRQAQIFEQYNNFVRGVRQEALKDVPIAQLHLKPYAVERLHSIKVRGIRQLSEVPFEDLERLFDDRAGAVRRLAIDWLAAQHATEQQQSKNEETLVLRRQLSDSQRQVKELQVEADRKDQQFEDRFARLEAQLLRKDQAEAETAQEIQRAAESDPEGKDPLLDPEPAVVPPPAPPSDPAN